MKDWKKYSFILFALVSPTSVVALGSAPSPTAFDRMSSWNRCSGLDRTPAFSHRPENSSPDSPDSIVTIEEDDDSPNESLDAANPPVFREYGPSPRPLPHFAAPQPTSWESRRRSTSLRC